MHYKSEIAFLIIPSLQRDQNIYKVITRAMGQAPRAQKRKGNNNEKR